MILGQIQHNKPRNAETSNLYQVAPKTWLWVKFHITNQGKQKHRNYFSLLKFDFGLNSTLKSKEWKNIEPISVSSKKFILVQIQHYRPRKAGTSNISLLKIDFGPNSTLKAKKCRIIKQLASENWFWAKFNISSKRIQEHRKFRS